MSLHLFTRGVVSPEPGRGSIKPVLKGGQAVEDPTGTAVALSRSPAFQQQPGHGCAKPEARGCGESLAAEPIPA